MSIPPLDSEARRGADFADTTPDSPLSAQGEVALGGLNARPPLYAYGYYWPPPQVALAPPLWRAGRWRFLLILFLILVSVLSGVGFVSSALSTLSPQERSRQEAAIVKKMQPGVVIITSQLGYSSQEIAGTGVIVSRNGLVLTNNHVIAGGTEIIAENPRTGRGYQVDVLGYDPSKDIAVLQLVGATNLTPVTLASTSELRRGQAVWGVGNAGGLGFLRGVPGVITAVGQSLTAKSDATGVSEELSGMLETNANIQPGDSGGPLVDTRGGVLGINTAASVTNGPGRFNLSYAVPLPVAENVATQVLAHEGSATLHVGATGFLGVGLAYHGKALVKDTLSNGPAKRSGIVPGDVLLRIDGHAITTGHDVRSVLITHHPGDRVFVTWRTSQGAYRSAEVVLGAGAPA